MSFFVKQVHRCLASRDSSTCVVILKPTSATRHQRHVQSWAVCRFVLFVSADTGWLLAASMFCTIVKIHKPVVCCKKCPRENSINCGFGGIYKTNPSIIFDLVSGASSSRVGPEQSSINQLWSITLWLKWIRQRRSRGRCISRHSSTSCYRTPSYILPCLRSLQNDA